MEGRQWRSVLIGRGPRSECFCRVVPRKGQRLKELVTFFLALMRYPSIQVRSALVSGCEQIHLEYSNTRLQTPASNSCGANSTRNMKDMIQCHKESDNSLGIKFFHHACSLCFALRHSEWLTKHLLRSEFRLETEELVVKTPLCKSPTGTPGPRATKLLNRILVGRRDADDTQPRVQQAWFLGVIGGLGEVIALHPDEALRHHEEWRETKREKERPG